MDPISTLSKVISLGLAIKNLIDTKSSNDELCSTLLQRVDAIVDLVKHLSTCNPSSSDTQKIVGSLTETLTECNEFVVKFQSKGTFIKVVKASDHESKFTALNRKLIDNETDLNALIGVLNLRDNKAGFKVFEKQNQEISDAIKIVQQKMNLLATPTAGQNLKKELEELKAAQGQGVLLIRSLINLIVKNQEQKHEDPTESALQIQILNQRIVEMGELIKKQSVDPTWKADGKELLSIERFRLESLATQVSTAGSASGRKGSSDVEELKFHRIPMYDLSLDNRIGRGGFGDVFLGRWLSRFQKVAVKKIRMDRFSDGVEVEFMKELEIMYHLRFENVTTLLGACIEPGSMCLVMEYAEKGSLFDFIHSDAVINTCLMYDLAFQAAKGLNFLHSLTPPILHRDIKSLNFLLTKNHVLKISDFGLSSAKTETISKSRVEQITGTLQYIPPERFNFKAYTDKCDVYGLGVMFWELASREVPYGDADEASIRSAVKAGERLEIPQTTPKEFALLIEECWTQDPLKRPSSRQIVERLEKMVQEIENSTVFTAVTTSPAHLMTTAVQPPSSSGSNLRSSSSTMVESSGNIFGKQTTAPLTAQFQGTTTTSRERRSEPEVRLQVQPEEKKVVPISSATTREVEDSKQQSWSQISKLEGHGRSISCVTSITKDLIVSGSADKTLRVWNVSTGKCVQVLKGLLQGHKKEVTCVAVLSEDRIVSGSDDETLRIWNVSTGKCVKVLKGHEYGVRCVGALSEDLIVSGSWDTTLRIWNVSTGKCVKGLEGHQGFVFCVAVLSEDRIVSGSWDKTLRIWRVSTGECVGVLKGHADRVNCVAVLSEDRIVSGSYDKTLRIWKVSTEECVGVLEGHEGTVNCVAVLSEDRIVSGSDDNTRIWDVSTGECVQILTGHEKFVSCVAVLSDDRIVSGSYKTLRIWKDVPSPHATIPSASTSNSQTSSPPTIESSDAQYTAAQIEEFYKYGHYGVQKDPEEGFSWLLKAAELGHADAQYWVGNSYRVGKGVPEDKEKAFYWYSKAAEPGNAGTHFTLGLCYASGTGVPEDQEKAFYWYSKAAEAGDASSQRKLGDHYANGKGFPKDRKKAIYWYSKAAEKGNEDAKNALRSLTKS